jgi:hypothetical protein
MKATSVLGLVALCAAALALGIGYALTSLWIGSVAAVLAGIAWLLAYAVALPTRLHDALWLLFMLLAGVGLLLALPAWLMLIAVVAALCAWDLAHLAARLRGVQRIDQPARLVGAHLRRLGLSAGLGLLLGGLALSVRVGLDFGSATLLALAALILLSQAVRRVLMRS